MTVKEPCLPDNKVLQPVITGMMQIHRISPSLGFLAENPPRALPQSGQNRHLDKFFQQLDETSYDLPNIIREKRVRHTVDLMPVFLSARDYNSDFYRFLSYETKQRLMLVLGMLTHAYYVETLGYKTVDESKADTSIKHLPAQLAIPLWYVAKDLGYTPSISYCLYSLWNWRKINPAKGLGLRNIALLHSFTGTMDESWFVWIHQIIEKTFTPAIPALLKAILLASPEVCIPGLAATKAMERCLEKAGRAFQKCVNVLERMRDHCDPKTYFGRVRMFYSYPQNVIYDGVDEVEGIAQNFYGETGGQTLVMHFLLAALGQYPLDDKYFPNMRRQMPALFRNFVEFAIAESKIHEYVLGPHTSRHLVRRYDMLTHSLLDWRAEHHSLANDFIAQHGEGHGTGSTPIPWLNEHYERTKKFIIQH